MALWTHQLPAMKIIYAEEFRKKFDKLPQEIQRLYFKQESRFKINWRDHEVTAYPGFNFRDFAVRVFIKPRLTSSLVSEP